MADEGCSRTGARTPDAGDVARFVVSPCLLPPRTPFDSMARQARVVIPGCPHHITHGGILPAQVFFTDDDRRFYVQMLRHCARGFGADIRAWRVMGNHAHCIAVPETGRNLNPRRCGVQSGANSSNLDLTEDLFA